MAPTPIVIDCWLDFASPESYLSLTTLRRAVTAEPFKEHVIVAIRPFLQDYPRATSVADAVPPPRETSSDSLDLRQLQATAEGMGIRLDVEADVPTSTQNSQQLVLSVQQDEEQEGRVFGPDTLSVRLAQSIMRTLFEMGGNIESPEVLIGVAQDLNIPGEVAAEALRNPLLAEETLQAYHLALHLGVQRPPVFLFNEMFAAEGYRDVESFRNVLRTVWEQQEAGQEGTDG